MIELYFDGYCETNPGVFGGYGVVIKKDNEIVKTISQTFTGENISNNVAEYKGLFAGLDYLLAEGLQDNDVSIYGDSMLVINQMSGTWRIKKGLYKNIAKQTKELVKKFSNIEFSWIPREQNTEADSLSRPESRPK